MATATPETKRSKAFKIFVDNLLIILIIIAVAAGVGLGIGLRGVWSHEELRKVWYLEFPGRLLLNMLKMLILPLVVSSLITGLSSISSHATGRLGGAAVVYYLFTTLFSVIIGIVLVLTIRPGEPDDLSSLTREGKSTDVAPLDALLDLISQCFPDNLVNACFERRVTDIGTAKFERYNKTANATYEISVDKPSLVTKGGTNVLGVVVFSIALGCVINHLGDKGVPLKNFFASLNSAVMVLTHLVIWYTPIGLIFLVAGRFITTENIVEVWTNLAMYMVTVLSGLAIHAIIILPLIYFAITRKNPFKFALNMLKAICTAWGTASSSATLPITMDCLIEKNGVNVNIVRFVVPVGATINMDGTALYEAVASIFIAQVNGFDLSVADVIIISLTSTAAAVGAAGVPQAGLVTMVIVLTAVGLPTEDVTLILAVDWFLDRFRTAVNVWGDSVGAGILDHLFKDKFTGTADDSAVAITVPEEDSSNASGSKGDRPPSYRTTCSDEVDTMESSTL